MKDGNQVEFESCVKPCVKCGIERPLEDFTNTRRRLSDGKYYKHSQCKYCRKNAGRVMTKLKGSAPPWPEKCDCCGEEFNEGEKPVLDHDYDTEKFRGWVCRNCNAGIGHLGDKLEGVNKAIKYLKRTGEKKWYHFILNK